MNVYIVCVYDAKLALKAAVPASYEALGPDSGLIDAHRSGEAF